MVVIRLARGGAKGRPFYKVVVTDSRSRRDGSFIEQLGFFNSVANEKVERARISIDRLNYWVGVGAQVSGPVARELKKLKAKAAV